MMLPSLLFSRNLRGNPIEIGMLNTPVRSNTEKRDGIDDDTSINLTDFAAERDAFLSHYITTLKVVHIRSIHIPIKQTRIISSKDKGSILGICNLFPFEQVDDVVDDKGLRR